jgi:hypothetical protein
LIAENALFYGYCRKATFANDSICSRFALKLKQNKLKIKMIELTRTNDPVLLSWLIAQLSEEGIDALVLDTYASVMEGSISAIQRRVMVVEDDLSLAQSILAEADEMDTSNHDQ